MSVKSWISDDNVLISVSGDNGSMIKGIDKETFVKNYDEYVKFYPKESRSKHSKDIITPRKAIEKCWVCKEHKPITEFCAYSVYEAPCFDCNNNKNKKKFSLPIDIWLDNFDINKVSKEIGGESQALYANKLPKVVLTDKETGKVMSFMTYKEAGKFLGMYETDSSRTRIVKKAGDKYDVKFTETKANEQVADLKKTFVNKRIIKTDDNKYKLVLVKPGDDSDDKDEIMDDAGHVEVITEETDNGSLTTITTMIDEKDKKDEKKVIKCAMDDDCDSDKYEEKYAYYMHRMIRKGWGMNND